MYIYICSTQTTHVPYDEINFLWRAIKFSALEWKPSLRFTMAVTGYIEKSGFIYNITNYKTYTIRPIFQATTHLNITNTHTHTQTFVFYKENPSRWKLYSLTKEPTILSFHVRRTKKFPNTFSPQCLCVCVCDCVCCGAPFSDYWGRRK